MAQGCNSSFSILDSDLHSHITGVDCLRGHKTGTDSLLKLLTSGRLFGKVALITGPRSSGKTAMAVAVARELAKLAIPALAMDVTEVFRPDPSGVGLTPEPTVVFTENLRRAVLVKIGENRPHFTLHWLIEEARKRSRHSSTADSGRVLERRISQDLVLPGVLFITGLKMDFSEEALYMGFFYHLKTALALASCGRDLAPAVVVLAECHLFRFSANGSDVVGLGNGHARPYHLFSPVAVVVPELVFFVLYTAEYDEHVVEKILKVRAKIEGAKIYGPALNELKKMALEGHRKEAHRLLHQTVKLEKARRKTKDLSSSSLKMFISMKELKAAIHEIQNPQKV